MLQYRWSGLILWLLALILVTLTLRQMSWTETLAALAGLAWQNWLIWILINCLIILIATERWQVLSRLLGQQTGFFALLLIKQAGQTISFITPGPQFGGEPFQIYWLHKRCGMAIHSAVLALGMDRFYELWINFLVLLLGVLWLIMDSGININTYSTTYGNWQPILILMFLLLLLLTALAWLVIKNPALISSPLEKLSARWLSTPRLKKLDDHWQYLGADLRQAITHKKLPLLKALLLSLAVWVFIVLEMWLVLGFFDIQPSASALVLILVAMRLALLLPLPGGIGTLEASILWSFQLLQLPVASAVAVIAMMRFRDALVLISGLWCLRLLQKKPQAASPL